MLRRKPGAFPVNCECRVGQTKAVFKRYKGKESGFNTLHTVFIFLNKDHVIDQAIY